MRTAALEWATWNIVLNAVEPGNVLTEGGHTIPEMATAILPEG